MAKLDAGARSSTSCSAGCSSSDPLRRTHALGAGAVACDCCSKTPLRGVILTASDVCCCAFLRRMQRSCRRAGAAPRTFAGSGPPRAAQGPRRPSLGAPPTRFLPADDGRRRINVLPATVATCTFRGREGCCRPLHYHSGPSNRPGVRRGELRRLRPPPRRRAVTARAVSQTPAAAVRASRRRHLLEDTPSAASAAYRP